MYNILNDVKSLTNVDEKYLAKLVAAEIYSINAAVEETVNSRENFTEIDIGIGTLIIKIEDNETKYKFIPGKKLESSIRDTVINEQNLLERRLEISLSDRLTKVYKDLL